MNKKHNMKHNKNNSNNIWKITTVVFAVILLLAIFTNGFKDFNFGSDNDEVKENNVISATGFTVVVIDDERCGDCSMISEQVVSQLKMIFPEMVVEKLDYSSSEGNELYTQSNLKYLPAFLFKEDVKNQENYNQVQQYLIPQGEYTSLQIGSTFDPTLEICDNGKDDTGNGDVDCEDSDCSETLTCNPDAFSECVVNYGLTPETVVFFYSDSCPWCALMKPGVEQLVEEGYAIKSVLAGDANDAEMIETCFGKYMGGGVPQFICPKTTEIRAGAFTDADRNLDLDGLRAWTDACIEG